jgi:hypothetical protein
MAYIHRSQMYHRAKCYSQAAADAVEAIRLYQSCSTALVVRQQPHKRSSDALMVTHIHRPGTMHAFRRARVDPLAWAWCVGDAFLSSSHQRHSPGLHSQVRARRGIES